jgi:hypothetical protein
VSDLLNNELFLQKLKNNEFNIIKQKKEELRKGVLTPKLKEIGIIDVIML